LDLNARTFKSLGAAGRLKAGVSIPEPQGVFPRYVEPDAQPTEAEGKKGAKKESKKGQA
jgi:methionyl-tRNA synthetase